MNKVPGYIKSMQILATALIVGLLVFTAIIIFLNFTMGEKYSETPVKGMNDIFLGMSAALLVITGLAALQIYRKGVQQARNLTGSIHDKLDIYRSTLIKYLALSESAGLLSVISLFLTADLRLLAVTAISLLLMLRGYVTKKKLVNELQLSWQEEQDL
ncbi:MAG TPA: hypothetical protein VHM26_09275 [Chitinophagaceae bacterium]|nr:hypothetical protein [Chitinophagaceae bacterium]